MGITACLDRDRSSYNGSVKENQRRMIFHYLKHRPRHNENKTSLTYEEFPEDSGNESSIVLDRRPQIKDSSQSSSNSDYCQDEVPKIIPGRIELPKPPGDWSSHLKSLREELEPRELFIPVVVGVSYFRNQPVHIPSTTGIDCPQVPRRIENSEPILLEDHPDPLSYYNIKPRFNKIKMNCKNDLNKLKFEKEEPLAPEVNNQIDYFSPKARRKRVQAEFIEESEIMILDIGSRSNSITTPKMRSSSSIEGANVFSKRSVVHNFRINPKPLPGALLKLNNKGKFTHNDEERYSFTPLHAKQFKAE